MPSSLRLVLVLALLPGCTCAGPAPTDGGVLESGGADTALDSPTPDTDDEPDAPRDALPDAPPDAPRDAPSTHDTPDAGGAPCIVPVSWPAEPAAEGLAIDALRTLSPSARPTWNRARGTFETLFDLALPLACPDGADVWEALAPLIDEHPEIFHIDRAEWHPPTPFSCAAVEPLIDYARLDRRDLAAGSATQDFISFGLRRVAGSVELHAVIASYLPRVPAAVADELARCGALSPDRARDSVLAETFPYTTFSRCAPIGSGLYRPGPRDAIRLSPPRWTWVEASDGLGVELTAEQTGLLIVHSSYVTPELMASDVNCPDGRDGRVYGFRLIFDAATGRILSRLPGLGCVVC